jgi:ferric-dicitrate binding protein FerR (iron transport regulator)
MKISMKRLQFAWKYRRFRPLWRRRRELGAGALAMAAIGAGILWKSRGIKQMSEVHN